jgi:hypothetical protein
VLKESDLKGERFMMASEEVRGSFCRDDSCVITDQLATGLGALERELLLICPCA